MSDVTMGFVVTLEKGIRGYDTECILNIIRGLRGVLSVKPAIMDYNTIIANQTVRLEVHEELLTMASKIINPQRKQINET